MCAREASEATGILPLMSADENGRREGNPAYILAAGGLLEREADDGFRLAVVHRRRYRNRDGSAGDFVLPKGKQRPGESLEETALREVREETGCRGRIVGPAFSTEHLAHGTPKVTTFFRMICEEEGTVNDASEVREVMWLTLEEAWNRLTYDNERALLEQAYRGGASGGGG